MPPEYAVVCGGLPAPPAGAAVELALDGPARNVFLNTEDVLGHVYRDVPPVLLDLLEVAAYVYAADQSVGRGGAADAGDRWRRVFAFRIPVREPDFWASADVTAALAAALGFASEDEYRFTFAPADPALHQQRRLDWPGGGTAFDGLAEDVVLFSGGLDSLAGVVREAVGGGRKVLLVNHCSSPKRGPQFDALVAELRRRAGAAAPLVVRVRANKAEGLTRGYTQRTRSFLFAALGAVFAAMTGRDRIRFYENGVVSLNLPLSAQVVGARASRTTHPRVLAGYARLLSLVVGRPFAVENPFVGLTKTDVVASLAAAGCGDLIGRSVSCGHTWQTTAAQPHCGRCSQCLDRRLAVLAAGQDAHDPAAGYAADVATGGWDDAVERNLLVSYLETANQVAGLDPLAFFQRYGEAFRALPAGADPDAAARAVYDLYRRHAGQVNRAVDRLIAANASAIRARTLPATSLVRLVSDGGPPAEADPESPPPTADNLFRRAGQMWTVRFRGGDVNHYVPSKGLAYLHAMLTTPGKPVSSVALVAAVGRRPADFALGDAGATADPEALAAYHARLAEIRDELDEARVDNDPGRVDRLEAEREGLLAEVKRQTGFGNRLKKGANPRERVRKALYQAVHRAIEVIDEYDTNLARHLRERVTCGMHPVYAPVDGCVWET
jgi:hypothetical protein